MCTLSEQQVALIESDVESVGINYSHLCTDLIDHICCDIETHMNQGISFNKAYEQVKKEFGIKGLRQIQQDTLMLIDKNYRIMKKSMKAIGVIAMSLMAFGALFKIMHWPSASIILSLSFVFTTLVFFPSLIWIMFKEANNKKQAPLFLISFIGGASFMMGVLFKIMHWPGAHILIFLGISLLAYFALPIILISKLKKSEIKPGVLWLGIIPLIVYVSGILFKINHWPGASILLIIGGIVLILVFIPFYYRSEIRNSPNPRIDFLFGIVALSYFIILSFLLQMNLSRSVHQKNDIQYHSFTQTTQYFADLNAKLYKESDKELTELNKAYETLNVSIEEFKIAIVKANNKTDWSTAVSLLKTKTPLNEPFSNINELLPSQHPNSPIIELENNIDNYFAQCNKLQTANNNFSENIKYFKSLCDDFNYQHAASALRQLSLLQYQLQLTYYQLINSNSNQSIIK